MSENIFSKKITSRRSFIEGLAAIGGLSLALAGMDALGLGIESEYSEPPKLSGGDGKKVVILGAGLAGLTAAYEMSKAGYDCKIIETRSFAGGRCQTARKGFKYTDLMGYSQTCEFDDGHYLNNGPWRIPYHHHSTLYYTKKFNIQLQLFNNDNDNSFVYFEGGSGPLAGKPLRKGKVAADVRGYTSEILAKAAKSGSLSLPFSAADKDKFVAYLITEGWLNSDTLSYEGTNGRGYDVAPGPGTNPGPGIPSKPYAMADLLGSKAWQVLQSVSDYEQQRTMFQPIGGMDQIAKGFTKHLGDVIQYSTSVKKIAQDANGVTISWVDGNGTKGVTTADYCVCTIPISVLNGIDLQVSPAFKEAMLKVAYAPVNKIGLQMSNRFWEDKYRIYGGHIYNDIPGIRTISLPSYGYQGDKGVLLGYYSFGGEAAKISAKSPADRAAFALEGGQKIFPEYKSSFENAFSFCWHLDKDNLGGWAVWSDEARKEAYPKLCEPDGRIYLAGEHLTYLGGWQAGAIESAWQQIEKIHKRVKA